MDDERVWQQKSRSGNFDLLLMTINDHWNIKNNSTLSFIIR